MSERYQIVSANANLDSKNLAAFFAKNGRLLIPVLDLVEQAEFAVGDSVDVMGRATIEAILQRGADVLAEPKQQRKLTDLDVTCHRTQLGRVDLQERQLREATLKPFFEILRVERPSGSALLAARSESCVGLG